MAPSGKDHEMAESIGITIGFRASPPLALRVPKGDVDKLLKALGGDGWHDLSGQDGDVRLNLAEVLFVRTEREEHRVGFGL
ncbi:MAG TPA: hypothetical protein VIL64_01575 [Solirubrobacteraceae bacterium]